LAKQYGRKTVLTLWGALKKIPQRLLEAFRYRADSIQTESRISQRRRTGLGPSIAHPISAAELCMAEYFTGLQACADD
jgi:hypothetical protein